MQFPQCLPESLASERDLVMNILQKGGQTHRMKRHSFFTEKDGFSGQVASRRLGKGTQNIPYKLTVV